MERDEGWLAQVLRMMRWLFPTTHVKILSVQSLGLAADSGKGESRVMVEMIIFQRWLGVTLDADRVTLRDNLLGQAPVEDLNRLNRNAGRSRVA